jgi:uncharacterized protein
MKVLLIPGLYDSGPEHWQSHWQREHGFARVVQKDWETPACADWVAEVEALAADDVILVGHSLGCATIAHWAATTHKRPRGALLVAPSDVEAPSFPSGTSGFAPMPLAPLGFPAIVVASSDDPYVTLARARDFASAWGAKLVEIGAAGHINSASGLGAWPAGLELLRRL